MDPLDSVSPTGSEPMAAPWPQHSHVPLRWESTRWSAGVVLFSEAVAPLPISSVIPIDAKR